MKMADVASLSMLSFSLACQPLLSWVEWHYRYLWHASLSSDEGDMYMEDDVEVERWCGGISDPNGKVAWVEEGGVNVQGV